MKTTPQSQVSKNVWRIGYFVLLCAIALITYFRVLHFTFYLDDWGYLWKAHYQVKTLLLMFLQWGTTLEFFLFTKLFGDRVMWWQAFGIILRAAAAYAVGWMVATVTRYRRAGILAGIFFACLPIGIQTVSWISAHVVDIDVIGGSVTFLLWVRYWRTGDTKYLRGSISTGLLAFALDPVRLMPLVLILGIYSLLDASKKKQTDHGLLKIMMEILCVGALVVGVWERKYILQSPPYIMLFHFHHVINLTLFWHAARLVGNYFWSMFNLMFGAFMAPVTMSPHPVFHMMYVVVPVTLLFSVMFYSRYIWIKKQNETGLYLLIFTSWMLLFFIPCWIFEPRQMVEAAHRYLVLPSVGFVGLLGYLVSRMRHISLISVAIIVIIAVNINASYQLLSFENIYRSRSLMEHFWKTIDASVPKNESQSIFMFLGEEPVRTWTFELSGSGPFALNRKISDAALVPLVTTDKEKIISVLCRPQNSSMQPIPLSHLHAWFVKNNGTIKDMSREWRNTFRTTLFERRCDFEE